MDVQGAPAGIRAEGRCPCMTESVRLDRLGNGLRDLAHRAAELDAADELAGFRDQFIGSDDPTIIAYLDGNSLGRPLRVTRDRISGFVEQVWGRRLIRAWDEGWMDDPVRVGDQIGRVALGAAPGQTVVGDSTSVMLYKWIRAACANQPGRDEIVVDVGNFPTDRFVVEGIAAELGMRLRWLRADRRSGVTLDHVAEAIGSRTALIALSDVAYRSGYLTDIAAITVLAHDHGALVLWDLCHSAGVIPRRLDEWQVDLAVGCTYKYLNGGPGSPAFGYVRADLNERLRQPIQGWMGAAEPFAMAEHYAPSEGIRRFLSGTPSILGMLAMQDMLALIEQAGLEAIRAKSVALTEFAIEISDRLLGPLGVAVGSPRDPGVRGSHVTLEHPEFRAATPRLWEQGVIPDFRTPDGLRVGLSPLSTSFGELYRGLVAVREVLWQQAR
jgi:kynureninase